MNVADSDAVVAPQWPESSANYHNWLDSNMIEPGQGAVVEEEEEYDEEAAEYEAELEAMLQLWWWEYGPWWRAFGRFESRTERRG